MIVKNEESRLRECLEAIRVVADEIVVADTGSTDGTLAVARNFGAETFEIPWRNDFAEARNETIRRAKGDWLLHLDADEVVDSCGAKRIREIVNGDGFGADAIEVVLANYSNDFLAWRWTPVSAGNDMARGYVGYIAIGLLRLFRNNCGFEYREAVHENITESVRERGGITRTEPIVIHHYGFAADPGEVARKAALYKKIAEAKALERPHDPKAWLDLAEQSFACGDAAMAEDAARKSLALDANNLSAASMLGNLLLNRGDLNEARALFESMEAAGVTAQHVGTVLGAIALRKGRLDEARRRLNDVAARCPSALQAHLYLARVLDLQGDVGEARLCLERARGIAPGVGEIDNRIQSLELRDSGEGFLKMGNPMAALQSFVQALKLDSEDPLTHQDVGFVLSKMGLNEKAQESFGRAVMLAPSVEGRNLS
jgi:Tfp pilus assembly protein PilF